MSIFSELLPKLVDISNDFTKNYKDDLQEALLCIDKFEEEFQSGKLRTQDKLQKDISKVTLESIHEDESESVKIPDEKSNTGKSTDSIEQKGTKKRSKHEVEGMESPEQEKRQKRNASVKALTIISQQVNVNLTSKLRRENSLEKGRSRRRGKDEDKENAEPLTLVQVKQEKMSIPPEPMEVNSTTEDDSSPVSVNIKQEINKDEMAMPPPNAPVPRSRKAVTKEKSQDSTDEDISSSRRATQRSTRTKKHTDTAPTQTASNRRTRASSRSTKQMDGEETLPAETRTKRTRTKKVTEVLNTDAEKEGTPVENGIASPAEKPRPKRTRRGQKAAEKEAEKIVKTPETESEAEVISPKEEIVSQHETQSVTQINNTKPKINTASGKLQDIHKNQTPMSPILQLKSVKPKINTESSKLQETKSNQKIQEEILANNTTKVTKYLNNNNQESIHLVKDINNTEKVNTNINYEDINEVKKVGKETTKKVDSKTANKNDKEEKVVNEDNEVNLVINEILDHDVVDNIELDKTRVLDHVNVDTPSVDMDKTMVLPNGVYKHAPVTPTAVRALNETVVLERSRETIQLDKHPPNNMNTTVVLDKADVKTVNVTDDNSLLTDDSDVVEPSTPLKKPPATQPTSAVKQKVQQFEEMASRVTRTKTRAMAKNEEHTEDHTPPDKCKVALLPSETRTMMENLIFNGKTPQSQISSSASKPKPISSSKSHIPTSSSKLSGINKAREADELRREREDARRKKEAMLEMKREMNRKKREDKMAAAAAARSAAESSRRAGLAAAARERLEKQAHADLGKQERRREAERKKQETARKLAETEERRKAEEQARQQRLAEEQKRAEAARKKQLEEAEAFKKEAARMEKEIERRQKEFMEKQKRKQRLEGEKFSTPHKSAVPCEPIEPVYMLDGFQYLNSDEEDDSSQIPTPAWSTVKARRRQLGAQALVAGALVDRLFSVRAHSPDLRDIFPSIERERLKRTSSAVWRTPPRLPVLRE